MVKVLVRVSEKWLYTMYMTVCIKFLYKYNAIVHAVITPGRSVQLWYSLVGILIIDWGSYLWSLSWYRSKVKGPIVVYFHIDVYYLMTVFGSKVLKSYVILMWSGAVPRWGGGGEGGTGTFPPPPPPMIFFFFFFFFLGGGGFAVFCYCIRG